MLLPLTQFWVTNSLAIMNVFKCQKTEHTKKKKEWFNHLNIYLLVCLWPNVKSSAACTGDMVTPFLSQDPWILLALSISHINMWFSLTNVLLRYQHGWLHILETCVVTQGLILRKHSVLGFNICWKISIILSLNLHFMKSMRE